jgi:hypothetical protein
VAVDRANPTPVTVKVLGLWYGDGATIASNGAYCPGASTSRLLHAVQGTVLLPLGSKRFTLISVTLLLVSL